MIHPAVGDSAVRIPPCPPQRGRQMDLTMRPSRKMHEGNDLSGFRETLPLCRQAVAARVSPHQAADTEAAVA